MPNLHELKLLLCRYRSPHFGNGNLVESSNVYVFINCLPEGQKCRAIEGIEPGLSAGESSEHTTPPYVTQ